MNGYGEIILMKKTKEEQTWKLFILQQIKKKYRNCFDKYEVNYIFIGSCEYQKYEGVNVALLSSLGEIVFKKENTMIVKL